MTTAMSRRRVVAALLATMRLIRSLFIHML
jgi:hypothetical protein